MDNWVMVVMAAMVVVSVGSVAHADSVARVAANATVNPRGWSATSDGGVKPSRGLSRDELDFGFRGIARSADQCLARHRKQGDTFPLSAVRIEVMVNPNGRVRRLTVPRKVRWTTFGRCMKAHSDRWLFPVFKGRPIRAAKTFRIEPS